MTHCNDIAVTCRLEIELLLFDKISLDFQIGPQYTIVNRSERVFNGNDDWNLNQTVDNVNDVAQAAGLNPDFYLQTKFGDVYAFDGIASDSDVSNGYYGVVQEIGSITDPDEPVIKLIIVSALE